MLQFGAMTYLYFMDDESEALVIILQTYIIWMDMAIAVGEGGTIMMALVVGHVHTYIIVQMSM